MKKLLIILGVILLSGCVDIRYENSIIINAPKNIVFEILEDYENYPNIIPEFHANVIIITDYNTGLGVQFINNSIFGGYKMESIFEVIEYRFNEYVKLENKSQYGFTELFVEEIENNITKYKLINNLRVPKSMENKLFTAYNNELEIIKRVTEYNFTNR